MRLLQAIARSKPCRIRHRWSRWAYDRREFDNARDLCIDHDSQFRMCCNCGAQETRVRV